MLIKLLTPIPGHRPGAIIDLPDADCQLLIGAKAAEPVTLPATPAPSANGQHSFADWLHCIHKSNLPRLHQEYGAPPTSTKAALNSDQGTRGGFLVPAEFLPQLLHLAHRGIFWPRATRVPMTAATIDLPALDHTATPADGQTAFFGNIAAAWQEQATAINEGPPAFKAIRLEAHELVGLTPFSNQWLADTPPVLETMLLRLFGAALRWFHEFAFLHGSGAGMPLGLINSAATVAVPRTSPNAFVDTDAAAILARLLPSTDPETTCWIMHPTVRAKLFALDGLKIAVSPEGYPRLYLFGYPIEFTEALPALGTPGDVLLADLHYYLIGDRQSVDIAFSNKNPTYFTKNQSLWRFVSRIDGQPWLRAPITLSGATTTASPFVLLQ